MKQKEKLTAAVWGFIVGDALGVPYEFKSREEMKQEPATGMKGFGTWYQPVGTWSDDTSMMLCVLENQINNGNTHDLARLFIKWYTQGYYTAHGKLFDIGITTKLALDSILEGKLPEEAGGVSEFSAGNGSLMRSLPYAFAKDLKKSMNQMVRENNLTHQLPLCHECCFFYVVLIQSLSKGDDKMEALKKAKYHLQYRWRIVEATTEGLERQRKFIRLFSAGFTQLPESQIKSGGYVIDSLEASVWCFLNSKNYEESVLKAVNLGGDTDTIAALTGAMAAVYYGIDSIPIEWGEKIFKKIEINCLLEMVEL